jgi:hypothetical protein
MVKKDFECLDCKKIKEKSVPMDDSTSDCECGGTMRVIISTAPSYVGAHRDNWNSYYDLQLGKHFCRPEEKEAYLKANDLVQTSGPGSPRKSSSKNTVCTKDQSLKHIDRVQN